MTKLNIGHTLLTLFCLFILRKSEVYSHETGAHYHTVLLGNSSGISGFYIVQVQATARMALLVAENEC
jgi:hypothetical protein